MLLFVTTLCVLLTVCWCKSRDTDSITSTDYESKLKPPSSGDINFEDKDDVEKIYDWRPKFKHKVVMITGASSGVGSVIAYYFAVHGAQLVLVGRNFDKLKKVVDKCKMYGKIREPYYPAIDMTIPEQVHYVVRTTVNQFERIDVVVNCAGILELGGITNTSLDQFDRTFNINVRSMYDLTMHCVPYLKKSRGTIINISSIAGLRAFPGLIAYCMSKSAVDQFTKCLALELAADGVRVNSVNPGVIDTGLHKRHGMDKESYKQYIKNSFNQRIHPLGRIATVDDVARAVIFLASDQSSFTTGLNFPVDGGRGVSCPR